MLHHDVDAFLVSDLADFVGDLLLVMVDNVIGAEFAGTLRLALVSGGGNHGAVKHFRNLDSSNAYARIGTENQDRLPGTNSCEADQHVPGCEENQRHASSLVERQRIRNRDDAHMWNRNQFAVTAVDSSAAHGELAALVLQPRRALFAVIAEMHGCDEHALAGGHARDIVANLNDLACDVAAKDVRQFDPGQAFAYPEIKVIHGAGAHADEHMVFAELRVGSVFVAQNFRPTEFVNANGFHDSLRDNATTEAVWRPLKRTRVVCPDSRHFRAGLSHSAASRLSTLNISQSPQFDFSPAESNNRAVDIYEEIVALRQQGRKGAVATIVNVRGSIPSFETAKMLVRDDGSIVGTVGGGCVEADVWQAAREVMESEKPRTLTFNLNQNPKYDTGLVCGGTLDIFIEPVLPPALLYVFGAGHVAVNLYRAAKNAGFDVTVIDDRETYASRERFPEAKEVIAEDFDKAMARITPPENSFIVIVTRGHRDDMRVLRWAVQTPARYVGMIGSKRKTITIFRELVKEGIPEPLFERVHAPVGFDIGAITPEEIAVAITAELIAARRKVERPLPHMSWFHSRKLASEESQNISAQRD